MTVQKVDDAVIRAAAKRGLRYRDVAEQLDCSIHAVCKRWHKLGLPTAPQGPRPGHIYDPEYLADIEAKLRAGWRVSEVAAHWGVSRQAISEMARRHGFAVRAMRDRPKVSPLELKRWGLTP